MEEEERAKLQEEIEAKQREIEEMRFAEVTSILAFFVTINDLCDLFQGFCDGEGGAEQAAPGGNGGGQAQDGGQWD